MNSIGAMSLESSLKKEKSFGMKEFFSPLFSFTLIFHIIIS